MRCWSLKENRSHRHDSDADSNSPYYREEYRKTYGPVIGQSLDSKELFDLYFPLQISRLEAIRKYLGKKKRVLDIGCSAGYFLQTIKPFVEKCVGIDLNELNIKFVKEELDIKAYNCPIEESDLSKGYFDIIFSWQTMEHMEDPLSFLRTIKEYLTEDGMVCITVPNIQVSLLSLYKADGFADFYFREPHLFYFSHQTLMVLMNKAGYEGTVLPFQWYNFLSDLYFLMTGKPQKSAEEGLSLSVLVDSTSIGDAQEELNSWIRKVDSEYREILNKHMLTDQIMFEGGVI